MACTRVIERMLASAGQGGPAAPRFEPACDVAQGGVLWALPALESNGLLRHLDRLLQIKEGFYSLTQVIVLLGIMALCRIKAIERLRFCPPGEMGKLLGLDRIPEVRTLRRKVAELAAGGQIPQWSDALAQEWLDGDVQAAGVLYVDGRVSVYHGGQTKLPRRYVTRERLCLRGLTDYWVNDQLGRPFFVVSTAFTDGMQAVLREEILPRLLREVPGQPEEQALARNPCAHRFAVIFDREGYSPKLFAELWRQRIACQTYRRGAVEDWPREEFSWHDAKGPLGQAARMQLAERGVWMAEGFWMREIRRLGENGHQTAILSSDYLSPMEVIGMHMFSRWTQENFFKYMDEHFDLDRLASYETPGADETKKVVNPLWRRVDSRCKSLSATLARRRAEFATVALREEALVGRETTRKIQNYVARKAELREAIQALERDVEDLKEQRKAAPHKIELGQLNQEDLFCLIAPNHKRLFDTIKMIAYRAETAMALLIRPELARTDDARALLREIYRSPADLIPDPAQGTLTVALHHLANARSDQVARDLAEHLNQCEACYPGTNLRLRFKLVSNSFP